MRLPRVRLRTLMVVVAVAAILLAAERLMRRRADFLIRARVLGFSESSFRNQGRSWMEYAGSVDDDTRRMVAGEPLPFGSRGCNGARKTLVFFPGDPPGRLNAIAVEARAEAAYSASIADHYGSQRAMYERAARYPWLPVPPDPPEPE